MTLTRRIIPCLDIKDGRVVKGTNFLGLRDAGDPVELACRYNEQGADEVVFLDITASRENRGMIIDVIQKAADELFLPLTVGGGIRTLDDIQRTLRAGADKVSINSSAIENPSLISESANAFGTQCIVVAIDAKQCNTGWNVYLHGGKTKTDIDALQWAKQAEALGAGEILLTSMDRDGTKAGYDLELTQSIADIVHIPVIASGGAGTLEHLYEGFVYGKADAVLAASIFHYREYSIKQAKDFLASHGIPIRPVDFS